MKRYHMGKIYVSEPIGQSERPTNIDYYVPTETDNYHYLNLLNTQAMPMFERKFE